MMSLPMGSRPCLRFACLGSEEGAWTTRDTAARYRVLARAGRQAAKHEVPGTLRVYGEAAPS